MLTVIGLPDDKTDVLPVPVEDKDDNIVELLKGELIDEIVTLVPLNGLDDTSVLKDCVVSVLVATVITEDEKLFDKLPEIGKVLGETLVPLETAEEDPVLVEAFV